MQGEGRFQRGSMFPRDPGVALPAHRPREYVPQGRRHHPVRHGSSRLAMEEQDRLLGNPVGQFPLDPDAHPFGGRKSAPTRTRQRKGHPLGRGRIGREAEKTRRHQAPAR